MQGTVVQTQALCGEIKLFLRFVPGGGGVQPKSIVACFKMKIRKDPYFVDFNFGFTPHSTHFWMTPHNFSVSGFTDKVHFPHISSTFCKYCCRTWVFLVRKHPIPHTHFCHIWLHANITPSHTKFTPILCSHDSTQSFHFWPLIPHQNLFEHATPHFGWAAIPGFVMLVIPFI